MLCLPHILLRVHVFLGEQGNGASEESVSSDTWSLLTTDVTSPSCSISSPSFSSVSDIDNGFHTPPGLATKDQILSFKIVGDNIDKYVKPREMRLDAQAKSLNYFNSYAVKGRVDVSKLEDIPCRPDFKSFEPTKLLPSKEDQKALESNFVIIVERVLRKYFTFFQTFCSAVPSHIKHCYSKEMARKSEVVGVSFCGCVCPT